MFNIEEHDNETTGNFVQVDMRPRPKPQPQSSQQRHKEIPEEKVPQRRNTKKNSRL